MIRVITITHQCGSGGAELGCQIAHKLGWDLVDWQLIERVARVADLDSSSAQRFDEQAARWCGILTAQGIDLAEICAPVVPRWLGQLDHESAHALATQLIRAAADFGECVIVACGAQFLLRSRVDVLNVLTYAPIEERVTRVQGRQPEYHDVPAFIKKTDSQTAQYFIDHYRGDWLQRNLYHLCVNTSIGLDLAATLIDHAVVVADDICAPPPQKEFCLCHLPDQP
jgi:CMP/dCMP kinase